ncbi:CPBP family intramembrane glutamic endopeptidase [Adhaeretor mobilis]|uniref:CAAX amino terminal protease self-immunity n=1 Tax=Adhaeretor mobilis TaxID=1930276 RepID=A0A517MSI1_9BACT|nr:CPBP family intramembrane glutamic endopeptidase [Adhaeretor mobilis]QDS97828.1 CAAX amino terminal protease self- immunity [Adhaeretor mobilis]
MHNDAPTNQNIAPVGIVFELSLGLAGALLAKWFGLPLQDWLTPASDSILRGVLATLPMLAGLALAMQSSWAPLANMRERVRALVTELFAESTWPQLAGLAIAAGVGEEILFRGALQPIISEWSVPLVGLAVSSFFFGAVHAATPTYFVVATVVGFYFGWLTQQYDDLVAPILAHSLYDFVALVWLQRRVA